MKKDKKEEIKLSEETSRVEKNYAIENMVEEPQANEKQPKKNKESHKANKESPYSEAINSNQQKEVRISKIPFYQTTRFKWITSILIVYLFIDSFFISDYNLPFDKLPKMTLTTIDDKEISIGGEQKQPYLIHFWSAWCNTCGYQYEAMTKLSKTYRVITIAVNTTDDDTLRNFSQDNFMPHDIIVNDLLGDLYKYFGIRALSTDIYVAANGDIELVKTKEKPSYITQWFRMWSLTD